jgi:hypothetical protein
MTAEPGRTPVQVAIDALVAVHATGGDFPGMLASILTAVAARAAVKHDEYPDLADILVAGRSGSWEASLVRQLVEGTAVGEDRAEIARWAAWPPG